VPGFLGAQSPRTKNPCQGRQRRRNAETGFVQKETRLKPVEWGAKTGNCGLGEKTPKAKKQETEEKLSGGKNGLRGDSGWVFWVEDVLLLDVCHGLTTSRKNVA